MTKFLAWVVAMGRLLARVSRRANSDGSDVRVTDIMRPDVKPVQRSPSGKLHIAFGASSRQQVRDFYEAAM